jgi:hypothetical protein
MENNKENFTKREPLWTVAGIVAIVTSIIGLLVLLGVDIDGETQAIILGIAASLAPIIVAIIARTQVYSPATVDKMAEEAVIVDPIMDELPEESWEDEDIDAEEWVDADFDEVEDV